jgi:hypothetical protein
MQKPSEQMSDRKERESTDTGRDGGGRFRSGNRGRPRGAKGRAAVLAMQVLDDATGEIARKAVEMAKAGNTTCIATILKLRIPAPKERSQQEPIQIPQLECAQDGMIALRMIASAAAFGSIDGDHARALTMVVQAFIESWKIADLEQRVLALEDHQS